MYACFPSVLPDFWLGDTMAIWPEKNIAPAIPKGYHWRDLGLYPWKVVNGGRWYNLNVLSVCDQPSIVIHEQILRMIVVIRA